MTGMQHTWAIVLAAGDGSRVSAFTLDASNRPVPKQYCAFGTATTLLDRALARAQGLVPQSRIAIVVAEQHGEWWNSALAGWPADNVVVQPRNRGTAVGLLLGILHVMRRDHEARFLVLPSDHHVEDEAVLHAACASALAGLRCAADRMVLLGMTPRELDTEYGWILCGRPHREGLREVVRFQEKPDATTAGRLRKRGAILNTFMFAATGPKLLTVYERTAPALLRSLATAMRHGGASTLRAAYDGLTAADFSRDVLEQSTEHLAAATVPSCGWSDLGTPDRLMAFLTGRPAEGRRSAPIAPMSAGGRRRATIVA